MDELQNGDPFPVKPGTNEYEALSFLVSNREYGFTPTEIADRTTISEASASKTMTRLFNKGLVNRSQGVYYIDPDRADDLKQRLDSLHAAVRLHETAPDDDTYAEAGWEEDVPSIDPDQNQDQLPSETGNETDTADEADELVGRLPEKSLESSAAWRTSTVTSFRSLIHTRHDHPGPLLLFLMGIAQTTGACTRLQQ